MTSCPRRCALCAGTLGCNPCKHTAGAPHPRASSKLRCRPVTVDRRPGLTDAAKRLRARRSRRLSRTTADKASPVEQAQDAEGELR